MKLLIDFQACQAETRTRGIGRYTFGLLKALAKLGNLTKATLHMNTTLTGINDPMLKEILAISPQTQVVAEKYLPMDVPDKRKNREMNTVKFSNIVADYEGVIFTDPMEAGNTSFTPESKKLLPNHIWCGAVIYDFIPMIFREFYLPNPEASRNYLHRLQLIRTCDCLLSLSEHTKKDAVGLLGISPFKVTNISGGVDPFFSDTNFVSQNPDFSSIGIKGDYILYIGAEDYRKNICGLIKAFAMLAPAVRRNLQLVVACDLSKESELSVRRCAHVNRLSDAFVFTGYISDDILKKLYLNAKLFVFPSLYEGLGLPIWEAVSCKAPVLAGNNSSQPEVLGTDDALFDAGSPQSIADKMEYALNNPDWLKELQIRQNRHMENFTWERSAQIAYAAIEANYADFCKENHGMAIKIVSRPRIAWFTPLPPQETGIANCNAGLLPHLTQDFDITLVIDGDYPVKDDSLNVNFPILSTAEFETRYHVGAYDQCVYHIGNSPFHMYMFPFIEKYGGAMVLHEIAMNYLAGFLESRITDHNRIDILARQQALFPADSEEYADARTTAFLHYMLNLSDGVFVHSKHAQAMLQKLAPAHSCPVIISELGTSFPILPTELEKKQLRKKLHIEENKFICSALGGIHRVKGVEDILNTLCQLLSLANDMIFIFVGAFAEENKDWFTALLSKASRIGIDVRTTGYVNDKLFIDYIKISDFALSLRTFSRGESSAVILNLLSHGIPTIVYDNGYFSEIDDNAVLKVPLSDTEALKKQIERLIANEDLRKTTSRHARDFAARLHWPTRVEGYREFISKSIEYKKMVKRYAETIVMSDSKAVEYLAKSLSY